MERERAPCLYMGFATPKAAPGLLPPCIRQRPFSIAGSRQGAPVVRQWAPQHILVPGLDREPFANAKSFDVVPMCCEPQAAAALFLSANSQVTDCWLHFRGLRS